MISSAQITKLMRPGLRSVFGLYSQAPEEWKQYMQSYTSDKNYEEDLEMQGLGYANTKAEGEATSSGIMKEGYSTIYFHKTVSRSFTITREAQEDDLYKSQFPRGVEALKTALSKTKNVLAAHVLNSAYDASKVMGDGKTICSTDHPTADGDYANCFSTKAALSEAALEQALIKIAEFKDLDGTLSQVKPERLIVPYALCFRATRLLESAFRTDTANNDISAIYNLSAFPKGYVVSRYLNNADNWFIQTDAPDGLKHYQRSPVHTKMEVDFMTDNIITKADERYSFNISNPRAVFGSGA